MRLRTLLLSLFCLPLSALAVERPLPVDAPGTFLGIETCGSSQCHGSPEPWRNATVLMSERRIWEAEDPHAQATAVLRSAQGQRIADALELGPADQAPACLSCHATTVPKAQQGPRYSANVGVTCESCHGAGGNFLSTHVQNTSTHTGNLAAGMYPTTNAQARARLCASCHVGDEKRQLSHAAFAAGHPRLRFENDTYFALLPAHARIDADYRRRKPVPTSSRLWAAGQLAAAQNLLERYSRAHGIGLFPDFAQYDCHACHHRFDGSSTRRPQLGLPPGTPPLQDAPLVLLPALATVIAPELETQAAGLARQLQRSAQAGSQRTELPALRSIVDQLALRLAAHRDRPTDALCLSAALLALPETAGPLSYSGAEALAMSVSALLVGAQESGALSEAEFAGLRSQVDRLYALLQDASSYDAQPLAQHSRAFRQSLTPYARCR